MSCIVGFERRDMKISYTLHIAHKFKKHSHFHYAIKGAIWGTRCFTTAQRYMLPSSVTCLKLDVEKVIGASLSFMVGFTRSPHLLHRSNKWQKAKQSSFAMLNWGLHVINVAIWDKHRGTIYIYIQTRCHLPFIKI